MQPNQVKVSVVVVVAFYAFCHVEARRLTGEGCYRDKMNDRAMPELLYNFRKTGELNWKDLTSSVIDKCKEAAQAKGYKCFGIQFYGECWSGKDACETYGKHGESRNCYCSIDNYKHYDEESSCRAAVGANSTNFVYKIEDY